MTPLNVALIVKGSASNYERNMRNMGWWSYPVQEFTWKHFWLGDRPVNTRQFDEFDLVFHEDGGNWCKYNRLSDIPIVFLSVDSTLSEAHYQQRLAIAEQADLVLVDHDQLKRFPGSRRWSYCVNDRVFKPLEKEIDITFHCGTGARKGMPGGVERTEMRQYLNGVAKDRGYSYRSGAMGLLDYAGNMGKSRVIVNWPRTPINRPHRVFDAMACGACLVTGKLPDVTGDYTMPGLHYVDYEDKREIEMVLPALLNGGWQDIAAKGYELVMLRHTWAIRAKELRNILSEVFGL